MLVRRAAPNHLPGFHVNASVAHGRTNLREVACDNDNRVWQTDLINESYQVGSALWIERGEGFVEQ